MFTIGEAIVQDSVATAHFACDLGKCKGACCTLPGGRGAPLDDDEIEELMKASPQAFRFLPKEHLDEIASRGFFEGEAGNYATTCIDNRACVFVYYEGSIAKCSLERAYNEGLTTWRKPISCHLFPIRISHFAGERLRYEVIRECSPAVERGEKEQIPLFEFLKDPLTRKYGAEWYAEFEKKCQK